MIYYIYQAFLWIIANFFITENIFILDTPNFILIIYYHSVKMLSLVNSLDNSDINYFTY